jgi:hypothetical protein
MNMNWLSSAIRCCGKPAIFYSLVYGTLGVLFLGGSRILDPAMETVGIILLLVGIGIFLVFLVLAFLSGRERPADGAGDRDCGSC